MLLPAATVCSVLAIGLLGFGYWGTATDAGQRRFDEMAGMIPYGAWYLGLLLAGVAVCLWASFGDGGSSCTSSWATWATWATWAREQ